jgi:hypothetical protein
MKSRVEDVEAVRKLISKYIEGSRGDAELLRSIFHPQAVMNGYFQGRLGLGSPEPFISLVENLDKSDAKSEYKAEIESIDVVGEVATAKLLEHDFMGSGFVDFFQLIRIDGEWKIISKTYHQLR